jgi:hypothetical protein
MTAPTGPDLPETIPEGYVDRFGLPVGYTKSGQPFVKASRVLSLVQARKAIEAHTWVTAELKAQNEALRKEVELAAQVIRNLADDKARVDAWEECFKFDAEKFPAIGWIIREQRNEETGASKYFLVSALGAPGEAVFYVWREAMDNLILLAKTEADRASGADKVAGNIPALIQHDGIEHVTDTTVQPGTTIATTDDPTPRPLELLK